MTKAFIRNNYNKFRAMWKMLNALATAPGDSCGMHTNISLSCFGKTPEKQQKAIQRLHDYIANNYATACALFKRDPDRTGYCENVRPGVLEGGHYDAINYDHLNAGPASRVELRLVGPQRSFAQFRNTVEVVLHLIECAKTGRDFTDPVKLWKGCNECVLSRLADLYNAGHITYEQYKAIEETSVDEGIKAVTRM